MMKNNYLQLLFLFALNLNAQQTVTLLKSTITTVGSSSVSINHNFIAQSIGQTGIIGKADVNSISAQQGFLTNILSFNINNSLDEPIDETFDFVVYPNPFVEKIKINFSEKTTHDIFIRIYDITGKIFKTNKYLHTNEIEIPLYKLSIGTYLIQVNSGENTITKKIIKKDR